MTKDYHGRIFTGLFIIGIGVLFLLGSLEKIDVWDVLGKYWPLILIFIGISHLFSSQFRNATSGIILILIGGFFMLANLDVLEHNLWSYFWPAAIIAVGLWILLRPRFSGIKKKIPDIKEDDLGVFAMFAGIDRRIESQVFRGGKATAVMGAVEIDMRDAKLAGNEATLELTAIMGAVEIRISREWKVVVDSSAILGAVEDKFKSDSPETAQTTLYIKASAVLGGIEIRS